MFPHGMEHFMKNIHEKCYVKKCTQNGKKKGEWELGRKRASNYNIM
jgi:hypothetical protein